MHISAKTSLQLILYTEPDVTKIWYKIYLYFYILSWTLI